MVDAIREKLEAAEARAAFHGEARRRLVRMKKSGRGIPAREVFAYLEKRARGGDIDSSVLSNHGRTSSQPQPALPASRQRS